MHLFVEVNCIKKDTAQVLHSRIRARMSVENVPEYVRTESRVKHEVAKLKIQVREADSLKQGSVSPTHISTQSKYFYNITFLPIKIAKISSSSSFNSLTNAGINLFNCFNYIRPSDLSLKRTLYNIWSLGIPRSFGPSRVARLIEDDTRRYERRSLPARKEPRSITPLHERRKSIDLRTEAAARRLGGNRQWIQSLRHRARARAYCRGTRGTSGGRYFWKFKENIHVLR